MNKDTKLFYSILNSHLKKVDYSKNNRTLSFGMSYRSNEDSEEVLFIDNFIQDYFNKTSKASFYRMINDRHWNNKPSYCYYGAFEAEWIPALCSIKRMIDLFASDTEKLKTILLKGTGIWQYFAMKEISYMEITKRMYERMLKNSDARVKKYAVKKAPIKTLARVFSQGITKNRQLQEIYKQRLFENGYLFAFEFKLSHFTTWNGIYESRKFISKSNAKNYLDFFTNNKDEIYKTLNNSKWLKMRMENVLSYAMARVDEKELYSFINIDSETLFRRKKLKELSGL